MIHDRSKRFVMFLVVLTLMLLLGHDVQAQGGCGSFCMPPQVLNPGRSYEPGVERVSFFIFNDYADFDKFYEGGDPINNPAGASAILNLTTLAVNVSVNERFSVDGAIPWIRKTQQTNRFGQRRAQGIGDVSVIGNILLTRPDALNRFTARIGLKFGTGSVEEPSLTNKLPNPFQVGSGAEDLLVGANYYRAFPQFSVYTNWLSRVPLRQNKFDYKFGNEHRAQGGVEFSPGEKRPVSFLGSLAFNHAGHDRTQGTDVPPRLLDGETVLNTGGTWLDFVPGIRLNLLKQWFIQTAFQIPLYENWHGERSTNVGQVRPDFRWQLSFGFRLSPEVKTP